MRVWRLGYHECSLGHLLKIDVANFGSVDLNLTDHQKVGEARSARLEIDYLDVKSLSYTSGAKVTKTDSVIDAVHHKLTPNRPEIKLEYEAFKEKNEDIFKTSWRKDVQILAKFTDHWSLMM